MRLIFLSTKLKASVKVKPSNTSEQKELLVRKSLKLRSFEVELHILSMEQTIYSAYLMQCTVFQDSRARRWRQVVHFDRLKPCNPNMRAQENNQPASGPSPTMTQQHSQSTSSTSSTLVAKDSTTPPGTNLQLVEDDNTDTQQAPEASDVSPTTEQPRRYPLRTSRRRPACYADGYQS